MKKSLVFALVMVLAMAGIASAEVKFGGELKTEYVIDTDKEAPAGSGTASAPLKLKLSAEEEGVWSVKADLKANAAKGAELKVGDWSMNLTDELFAADLWGGDVEKAGVKTPMEFVNTGDDVTATSGARLRLTSDVAGYVDLSLDYDPNEIFLFAKKALDDVTVGAAINKDLTAEGVVAAGHVVYKTGALTLTGEVGVDTTEGKEEDNLKLGGKVGYKLTDKMSLSGKVTHKAEKVGDELLLEPGITYTESLYKATVTYTWKDDLDNEDTKATNKVKANVTYRSNEDVAFDDLFDDYDTLTGYAAFAEGAYTTAKDYGDDNEPLMEVKLKGAAVAVPGMVWAKGEFLYKSDDDKTAKDEDFEFIVGNNDLEEVVLNAKNYYRLTAESTVLVTDKLKAVPSIRYAAWTDMKVTDGKDSGYGGVKADDMNELELTAKFTYELSASSEVGLSYTDRTQKLTTAEGALTGDPELKDGFAKIWFKTKF